MLMRICVCVCVCVCVCPHWGIVRSCFPLEVCVCVCVCVCVFVHKGGWGVVRCESGLDGHGHQLGTRNRPAPNPTPSSAPLWIAKNGLQEV